ncbi:MAG: tetratricopeptide repeat protein [Gammaproteobacteria bacterium]|nr:tetratricopeptide repeat protein [Gammaproteobacteria bacterium]MDE0248533.1 tetratricopeptide repeat protein [Gammaproteobacteria bacterium]
MPESLKEEIRILSASFRSERDPDGRAFAPLADAYLRSGDVAKAEEVVREGVARLPDFATGHLVAARVARARGDLQRTRTHADRVISLDPGNALARVERAAALVREGDAVAALLDLRSAISIAPGGVAALTALVVLEAAPELGELVAVAVAEHANTAPGQRAPPGGPPPADGDGARVDGRERAPRGDPGASMAPGEVRFIDGAFVTRTMADLYAKQGLTERAVTVYEHLLRADPENADLVARRDELASLAAPGRSPDPPPDRPVPVPVPPVPVADPAVNADIGEATDGATARPGGILS